MERKLDHYTTPARFVHPGVSTPSEFTLMLKQVTNASSQSLTFQSLPITCMHEQKDSFTKRTTGDRNKTYHSTMCGPKAHYTAPARFVWPRASPPRNSTPMSKQVTNTISLLLMFQSLPSSPPQWTERLPKPRSAERERGLRKSARIADRPIYECERSNLE